MEMANNNEELSATREKTAEHESVMPSPETVQSARSLVQQNDLDGLRSLLASCSPQERRSVFQDAQLQSSLHVAFSHGNRALLTFLLEECGVDVDHRDEEQGVTVLHLAVEAGDVVTTRLLLDHGAQVNFADDDSGTQGCSHSSLLRVALSYGNPQIFRILLEAGLELKMWSEPKTTWPPESARGNVKDMVDCAMDFGLCRKENQELLGYFLEVAVRQGSQAFSALWPHRPPGTDDFRLAVLAPFQPGNREGIFDTISSQGSLSPSQRLDLMEYRGACFVLSENDFSKGLSLWKQAMRQRWKTPDQPLMKKSVPHSLFEGIKEPQTPQELQDLDQSHATLKRQAVYILERVFVDKACLVLAFLAKDLFQEGNHEDGLFLLIHVLQKAKYCEDPFAFVLQTRVVYGEFLTPGEAFLDGLNVLRLGVPLLKLFLHCLKKCFLCIENTSGRSRHDVFVPGIFSCSGCCMLWWLEGAFCAMTNDLLLRVKNTATEDDLDELKKQVVSFIQLDPRLGRRGRLHMASMEEILSPEAIQLLVECSAEVGRPTQEMNSAAHLFADRHGNSPLHILAETMTPTELLDEGTISCFVEHDAHLCARNKSGRSVLDILESRGIHFPDSRPLPLVCQAARVVRREQDKGVLSTEELPRVVKFFLLNH